jgi:hypothetical protein
MRSPSSKVFTGVVGAICAIGAVGAMATAVLLAATPPEELARLGADLTPLGG